MNNPVVNKYQPLDVSNGEVDNYVDQSDRNEDLLRRIEDAEKRKKSIALFSTLVIFCMILWSGLSYDEASVDIIPLGDHHHHHHEPAPSLRRCDPGILRNITSQMPFKIWNSEKGPLPYYAYANIDQRDQREFKNVVVIAHGFGRNANEYFCSGVNALMKAQEGDQDKNIGDRNLDNTLIITAQFLSPGDVCWNKDGKAHFVSKTAVLEAGNDAEDCGLPIWRAGGWISGDKNLNNKGPNATSDLYSYDVFNLMIDRLMDTEYFPNVESFRMFGFSAGAQTTMRYAVYPQHSDRLKVKFVIGDPSTMIYFNDLRKNPYDEPQFSRPEKSWLKMSGVLAHMNYNYSADCTHFNDWKYGFENRVGYLAEFSNEQIEEAVSDYVARDITYMIGTEDNCNCLLDDNSPWCYDDDGKCVDHSFDKSCSGMLQGQSRFARMQNWVEYLEYMYPHSSRENQLNHQLYEAKCGHDFECMMRSSIGLCELFEYDCTYRGYAE